MSGPEDRVAARDGCLSRCVMSDGGGRLKFGNSKSEDWYNASKSHSDSRLVLVKEAVALTQQRG